MTIEEYLKKCEEFITINDGSCSDDYVDLSSDIETLLKIIHAYQKLVEEKDETLKEAWMIFYQAGSVYGSVNNAIDLKLEVEGFE